MKTLQEKNPDISSIVFYTTSHYPQLETIPRIKDIEKTIMP